ncbi:MAG: hypothetical protein KJO95_08190 [Gammaproteobacteria bacterium]|nr:hypothetical protein [Gammaproteobacteria bacterium]
MKRWQVYLFAGPLLVLGAAGFFTAIGSAEAGNCGWQNMLKEKRSIATQLCVAMVRSGAYTELDDNELSGYCIRVASHLGDSDYDHMDEDEGEDE